MKNLLIGGAQALNTTATIEAFDPTTLALGEIAIFGDGAAMSASTTDRPSVIQIFVGRGGEAGADVEYIETPRIWATKSEFEAATTYSATITIPATVVEGIDYTIVLVKKGTVPHERYRFTATTRSKTGDTATTIAERLTRDLDNKKYISNVEATNAAGVITLTALNAAEDFELTAGDGLYDLSPAITQIHGFRNVGDEVYVKDLYRQTIGGRGINNTDTDGAILYTPPTISGDYNIYNLFFFNRRDDKTTTSEDVKQIVHIALPVGSAAEADLDAIIELFPNYPI